MVFPNLEVPERNYKFVSRCVCHINLFTCLGLIHEAAGTAQVIRFRQWHAAAGAICMQDPCIAFEKVTCSTL